jgi:hypothetical protein
MEFFDNFQFGINFEFIFSYKMFYIINPKIKQLNLQLSKIK